MESYSARKEKNYWLNLKNVMLRDRSWLKKKKRIYKNFFKTQTIATESKLVVVWSQVRGSARVHKGTFLSNGCILKLDVMVVVCLIHLSKFIKLYTHFISKMGEFVCE